MEQCTCVDQVVGNPDVAGVGEVATAPSSSVRCEREGVYRFVWEWGADGVCCEQHRWLLDTLATQQLQRRISFTPLNPPTDRPPAAPLPSPEVATLRKRVDELVEENTALTLRVRQLESELDDPHRKPALELAEVERKPTVERRPHK